MPYIAGTDRQQVTMLPECIEDYIAEDNPVRVIEAFVNSLDMETMRFKRVEPASEGRPGYDPRDMLKLYIYGYFNKIRSSRRLQRECGRNLELMWLLGKLQPDFRCIADFRKDNALAFKEVFSELVRKCVKLNLFTRELLSIDGSKFQAVNSKDRNFTDEKLADRIRRMNEALDGYMRQMDAQDEAETDERNFSAEELRAKIAELTARREQYEGYREQLRATGETQLSLTDPEARLMKGNGKLEVSLNVQTAVDAGSHMIAGFEVSNSCNDMGKLEPTLAEAKKNLGIEQITSTADKGYRKSEDILNCIMNGDVPHVPPRDGTEDWTFKIAYQPAEITEVLLCSTKREDIEACIHAGGLPHCLRNRGIEMIVTPEKGEPASADGHDDSESEPSNDPSEQEEYFVRDADRDTVICPAGAVLKRKATSHGRARYANKGACARCERKCTQARFKVVEMGASQERSRCEARYERSSSESRNGAIEKLPIAKHFRQPRTTSLILRFQPDKAIMRKRKCLSEHPFGTVKRWCDGSYLLMKGVIKSSADLAMSFIGYDMKRAIAMLGVAQLVRALH